MPPMTRRVMHENIDSLSTQAIVAGHFCQTADPRDGHLTGDCDCRFEMHFSEEDGGRPHLLELQRSKRAFVEVERLFATALQYIPSMTSIALECRLEARLYSHTSDKVPNRWRIKEERRLGALQERIEAMEGEDGVFRQLEEESSMVDGLAGDIEDALAKFDELAGQLEVGFEHCW